LFYPRQPEACRREVEGFVSDAPAVAEEPSALIAPHAGYRYSGPIAGTAYRALRDHPSPWNRVILIGPSHTTRFEGIAAPTWEAFDTPLGPVPVDRDAIDRLTSLNLVHQDDAPHEQEHGLEVHLPFIGYLLPGVRIVPLVTGTTSPRQVAKALAALLEQTNTLPIVSSDLSHYHTYAEAQVLDAEAAQYIEENAGDSLRDVHACGRLAIQGLLEVAGAEKWHPQTLDLRNSGDTAGPHDQVVGYGAFSLA
jgi:hypothetical protein